MLQYQDLHDRDVNEGNLIMLVNPMAPFNRKSAGIVLGPFERYVKNRVIFTSYLLWPEDLKKPALYVSSNSSPLSRCFSSYSEKIYVGQREIDAAIRRRPSLKVRRNIRSVLIDLGLVSLLSDVRLSHESKQDLLLGASKPIRRPSSKNSTLSSLSLP